MAKSTADKALEQLENMRLTSILNTEEKKSRFIEARQSGYSNEFALIFALQESK